MPIVFSGLALAAALAVGAPVPSDAVADPPDPAPCPQPAAAAAAGSSATDSLCRLVEGPAGLLLTPEERALLPELRTREERVAFVEWFWARRDPDPATARNEFRDEFEGRLSFVTKELAGGDADALTRTTPPILYLVLGEPTEIYWIEDGVVVEGDYRDLEVWVYDVGSLIGGHLRVPLVPTSRGKLLPSDFDSQSKSRLRRALEAAIEANVARPTLAFREYDPFPMVDTLPLTAVLVRTFDGLHGEIRVRLTDLYGEPWEDGVAYWLELSVSRRGTPPADGIRGAVSLRVDAERFRRIEGREIVIALWIDDSRLPDDPVLVVREQCTGRGVRLEPAVGPRVADAYSVRELLGTGEFVAGAGTVVAFVAGPGGAAGNDETLSVARSWSSVRGRPRPWPSGGLRIIDKR